MHRPGRLLLLLVLPIALLAHTEQLVGTAGNVRALSWTGTNTLTIWRNAQTSALLPNVTAGSDPMRALDDAFATLSQGSGLSFVNGGTTSTSEAGNDGRNIVSFVDTPTNRAMTGSAIAVTVTTYSASTGTISDADILFNPAVMHTTVGASGAYDVESAALHEGGHLLGQDHSPLMHSVMFPFLPRAPATSRDLSADDVAGLATLYPANADPALGTVTGRVVRAPNQPVFGAHVVLQDALSGAATTGGVSFTDGSFTIEGAPPGLYHLYVEPLDAPMTPASLSGGAWGAATMDANFETAFLGGSSAPAAVVKVPVAGTRALGDVVVGGSAPAFNLRGIALTSAPNGFSAYSGVSVATPAPYSAYVAIGGANLAALPDSAFSVDGPFVSLGATSTARGTLPGLGDDWRIFPLTVSAEAPPGGYSIRVSSGNQVSILSGALRVEAPAAPVAIAQAYGASGSGSMGTIGLSGLGRPSLGNGAFGLRLTGTPSAALGYLVLAGQPARFELAPSSPVHLDPNTFLLPLPGIAFPLAPGATTVPTPIPNDPALSGLDIYAQCLTVDGGAVLGLGFSNGLWLRFQ